MVIRVKSMSHVRKSGNIVLNQSLIYIHLFPPVKPQIFYLPFHYVAKKTLFLGTKNIGGTSPLLPSEVTPMDIRSHP